MGLKIDLTKTTKSNFRVIIGIVSILAGSALFFLTIHKKNELDFVQILFPIILFFSGTVHLLEGLGYSVDKLLGWTTYIFIDKQNITFKKKNKSLKVLWTDIKSIDYNTNFFQIMKNDGSFTNIDMSDLNYENRQRVKQTINSIAHELKIENL